MNPKRRRRFARAGILSGVLFSAGRHSVTAHLWHLGAPTEGRPLHFVTT